MLAHVFISGFVQGVGYRQFVKRSAKTLGGLTGWVKNLPDNRVEAVLQGRIENIKKMIPLCRKGPFLSEVKDVQVNFEDSNKYFDSFEIVR
jgi:acylphosphatase